mgnify:CR=1 FL=1
MRLIASSETLYKSLQNIVGVVNNNTIMPILENFLFVVEGNTLNAIATDLETTMKVKIAIQSSDTGKVCVQAKLLMEYLKNLPEQPVTFEFNMSDFGIDITSEQGKYKIVGQSADTFPEEPVLDDTVSFSMSATELSDGVAKTVIAAAADDVRIQMSGVYFELHENNLTLVATDAHRLVRCIKTDVKCPKNDSFIVPRKALFQFKNALNSPGEVKLSYNRNHLFVSTDDVQLSCRLIDARFPDYKVVIPADNPYKLIVSKNEFIGALRRVNVFANRTTNQVVLDINGNSLHLYAQDVDFSFEGNETMNCQYTGEDMKVAFNAKLMLELITVLESDEILFELSSPNRAGLIKPTEKREQEDLLILLMPLMLN